MIKISLMALLGVFILATVVAAHGNAKVVAPTKFGIFREDCFDLFFNKFDFTSDMSCIKFSFSKLIGYLIIAGSTIFKVPQIMKIVKAGSAEGISPVSYYMETLGFINTAGLSMHLGLSFSVYGEALIIITQNALIILLIWSYSKDVGMVEKLGAAVLISGYGFALFTGSGVPEDAWALISSATMLFNIASRGPQIIANWSNGSTGQLAFFTMFLGFAGSVARLATVFIESDDFMYRAQFTLATVLNGIIILQFALYWNSDDKKVDPKGAAKKSPGRPKKDTKKTQ